MHRSRFISDIPTNARYDHSITQIVSRGIFSKVPRGTKTSDETVEEEEKEGGKKKKKRRTNVCKLAARDNQKETGAGFVENY